MTADRPTRESCSDPGSHPVMCRCLPPSIAAAVAARPAGQEADGPDSIESLIRWVLNTVDPAQPGSEVRAECVAMLRRFASRPSSPSSPVPDEGLREEIARALYRAKWHDMLVWEKAGAAAQMQWRARAAAVLSLPSLRRLLDTAAAVERVRAELSDLAESKDPADRMIVSLLRRALDGDQP